MIWVLMEKKAPNKLRVCGFHIYIYIEIFFLGNAIPSPFSIPPRIPKNCIWIAVPPSFSSEPVAISTGSLALLLGLAWIGKKKKVVAHEPWKEEYRMNSPQN